MRAIFLLLAFTAAALAGRGFNGSSQYISGGSVPTTTLPITTACWFKAANVTASGSLVSLSTNAGTARYTMSVRGDIVGDPLRAAAVNSGGTAGQASTSTSYTAGVWHHALAIYSSSTSRTIYLNGAGSGTNTTSITVGTGINRTLTGAQILTTVQDFFNGSIAEVGIWGVALDAGEISALASGFSPRLIRPASLLYYAPLVGTPRDLYGMALTDNSTTAADHVRIFGSTALVRAWLRPICLLPIR